MKVMHSHNANLPLDAWFVGGSEGLLLLYCTNKQASKEAPKLVFRNVTRQEGVKGTMDICVLPSKVVTIEDPMHS